MDTERVRVLLIEDNPGDARLIREMLSQVEGTAFELECVDRLSTGLERLTTGSLDVLLLDLNLPDSQGLKTFTTAQARSSGVPIVVLTGLADEATGIKAVHQGAQDYLPKGEVDANSLARALRYAIERHRLLGELEAHETRLRKIITSDADGIVVVDANRRIQFVNPAAEAILGRKAQELVGEMLEFPVVPGEATEIEISRQGRGTIVAEVTTVEIEWEGASAHLASLRDITERKRTEAALARADKLRALAQTAGGIAHEFNNVLVRMRASADLALMDLEEDPQSAREEIESVISGATDAARVVRRLEVLYQRADDLSDFVPLQLDGLVSEALAWIRSHWQHDPFAEGDDLKVRTNLTVPPPVWGNPDELRRVLTRFIGNAIQAMPGGGTLAVETGHDSIWSFVTVSDTDRGIRSETKRDAFEPFYTTRSHMADELGMVTAINIIERHGGETLVESKPGVGTSFTLRLPTAEGLDGDKGK